MRRLLQGKVFVVTGASSGIGAATALAIAQQGGTVVLAARGERALAAVARRCHTFGPPAHVVRTDVTDEAAVRALADTVLARYGRMDGWINNAAVGGYATFDTSLDHLRATVETNLLGTAYGCAVALQHMKVTGRGVIVNVASVLGPIAVPYLSGYVATKAAVRALSASVRQELRHEGLSGVAVCTVLPAAVDTPFYRHAANTTAREVRPPLPVYSPALIAAMVVSALVRPRDEIHVGVTASLLDLSSRLAPRTTERLVGLMAPHLIMTANPAPSTDGNLGATSFGNGEVQGGWHGRRLALLDLFVKAPAIAVSMLYRRLTADGRSARIPRTPRHPFVVRPHRYESRVIGMRSPG